MDEICKSCANEYPSVECINCGEKHYNFVTKDYPTTNYDKIKNIPIGEIVHLIDELNLTREFVFKQGLVNELNDYVKNNRKNG